jgi:hypothetical protein
MTEERAALIQQALKELELPSPRKVRRKTFKEAGRLWIRAILFVIVFFLITLLFSFQMLIPFLAHWFGLSAPATVLTHNASSGRHGTYYGLIVEYPAGFQKRVGTIGVSQKTFANIPNGAKESIRYLPPFFRYPALDSETPTTLGFLIFVGGMGILAYSAAWFRKQKYLLIHGKAVSGVVEKVDKKTGISAGFDSGKEHLTLSVQTYYYGGKNAPGDEILVLQDPENSKSYIIYDPAYCFWKPVQENESRSDLVS